MSTTIVDDLIAELCIYLHSSEDLSSYNTIVNMVINLESDKRTAVLLQECITLRNDVVSFKIRDIQKRICEIDKLINTTRFCTQGDKYEIACLDALYSQSKQFNSKLSLLYKLDMLLLTITNIVNDVK